MRRTHGKSRYGCKGCKARRVKCDELRPSCTKCSQGGRTCSYLDQAPSLPQGTPLPLSKKGLAPRKPPLLLSPLPKREPCDTGAFSRPPQEHLSDRFSLVHMGLLHHFEHGVGESMRPTHPGIEEVMALFVREAFKTPYLMDELLGHSAAHKSLVPEAPTSSASDSHRHFYATEATRLQTRSLTLYNAAAPDCDDEHCLPMFLYASLLGQHLFYDVLAAASATSSGSSPLGTALERLTSTINVHRGLSAIAKSAWPMFPARQQRVFLQTCLRDRPTAPHHQPSSSDTTGSSSSSSSDSSCAYLLAKLSTSHLSPGLIATHSAAVSLLQRMFATEQAAVAANLGNLSCLQDWLICLPAEYVSCLNERRPEALVVLAYYCVLLHRGREYWFIGDLGRRLVGLVDEQLGPFWGEWLAWPKGVVGIGG